MNIQERILLALSTVPESAGHSNESSSTDQDALSLLEGEYPDFGRLVSGKRIMDFGCGLGHQSIALIRKYDCSVVGVDSSPKALAVASDSAARFGIPSSRLLFVDSISDTMIGTFDVVLSQNSFEHFGNPLEILDKMLTLINSKGKILITFGPPWLAPYGSHMQFFCKIPWINILFSEKTVMNVRSHYRDDGAMRYVDVESGLNKMTVNRFENMIRRRDLKMEYRRYSTIKNLNLLSRLPVLRELFINHVSVILSKVPSAERFPDHS